MKGLHEIVRNGLHEITFCSWLDIS